MCCCCVSVQMYININQLLKDKNPRKNGFDFIVITKNITDQNMGDNRFNDADLKRTAVEAFIKDAALWSANQFRAKWVYIIPFSTDLFLESLKNDLLIRYPRLFVATRPAGSTHYFLPISWDINIFAPAQGLPQLSGTSAYMVHFPGMLWPRRYSEIQSTYYVLSDRINSVLVPEEFLKWANLEIW